MEKQDGRGISREALEERRRTIIRMKENGFTEKEIVAAIGCSRQTISPLWNRYKNSSGKKHGEVFEVKQRGKKFGENRTLTPMQESKIQKIIVDKYPDQMKFDFALWTREAVRQLIRKEFGIDMPIRTVGAYLARWGYTPQKPVQYAYERDDKKVQEWLKKKYPMIKRKAKREKAEIYWGDETTVKASDVRGRGYAPIGKTPVVKRTEKKENVSMISAITNQGKVHWKLYEGSITGERVLEFVKQLIKYKRGKTYLILDNAKTHHSKALKKYVEEHEKKIEIYYLPPYSPDLNPDEHLNSDVKYGVGSRTPKRTKEGLRKSTEEEMNIISKSPERIARYFKDPAILYAA